MSLDLDENKLVSLVKQNLTIKHSPILLSASVTAYLLKHSDVKFLVGDKEIDANSMILRSQSEVFEKMLCGEMKEKDVRLIKIDRYSCDVMHALIQHMHNEDINISDTNIVMLTECANYYSCITLRDQCLIQIKSILTTKNAYSYYLESVTHGMDEIKEICEEFICSNITSGVIILSIVDTDDMVHMITLCKTKYKKYGEYDLFCAIVIFVRHAVNKYRVIQYNNMKTKDSEDIINDDNITDDDNDADIDYPDVSDSIKVDKLIELIDINNFGINQIIKIEYSTQNVYLSAEKLREYYKKKIKDNVCVGETFKGSNIVKSIKITTVDDKTFTISRAWKLIFAKK